MEALSLVYVFRPAIDHENVLMSLGMKGRRLVIAGRNGRPLTDGVRPLLSIDSLYFSMLLGYKKL